jgi:hypothetical protein
LAAARLYRACPGTVKLDDANAVMLRVIAARVAPG